MIVLDFGSGETCQNDIIIVKEMIDELNNADTRKKEVVIKWQLFNGVDFPKLSPLDKDVFNYAYLYAKKMGYKTTASVFDKFNLAYLLEFKIPFVKIANIPKLHYLAGEVPRKINVLLSVGKYVPINDRFHGADYLACVRKYPAKGYNYDWFDQNCFYAGISDHTNNFELYKKYHPRIYETHFKLPNSIGADSGSWAKTPEQLKEIL